MNRFYKVRKNFKYSGKTPISNLDYYYGPYTTKEEALAKVPREIRDVGFTVGIKQFIENPEGTFIYKEVNDRDKTYHIYEENISDSESTKYSFYEIEEFQWKKNIDNLEKKGESSLTLALVSPNKLDILENFPIKIKILGGIAPSAILVYEVINDQEFLTNYSYPGTIPLNSDISLNLNIQGNPRTIIYRIRVIDKNNQFALTVDDHNYVQVIVNFKEIEIYNINTNSIDSLLVKNANNLQGKIFTFNVGYIESILDYNVDLYIGDNLIEHSIVEESPDFFKVTLPQDLSNYGGEVIKIKLSYTGSSGNENRFYEIVTIMARNVFSNIKSELPGEIFYLGNKALCRIYFEAESLETYSIVSTQESDFSYSGRIMAYLWNTIYITPEKITSNPKFTFLIENTKEVLISSQEGAQIKQFTKEIFSDSGRNPEDPRTFDNNYGTVKSFILDLYCFINWTNHTDSVFSLGNISIDKELIHFGYIVYPTPLLRDVHIGFEYQVKGDNLEEYSNRTIYSALYIDGVLCKNIRISELNNLGIAVNNINYNENEFIIKNINIYTSPNSNLYPFTSINFQNSDKFIPILLNNYEYYTTKENENQNLPLLKLTALDFDDSLYTIRNNVLTKNGQKPEKAIIPSKFGTLEEGQIKYDSNIDPNSDDYNILLKQKTDLKKALQKSRGVLCSYQYGSNELGYVEVHTLGTSTLDYRLPNFKFTFLNSDMTTKKVNFVAGYNESVLTAKTDYMDSSHLNNTPTATYYNKIIHSGFFLKNSDYRSPSAKEGGLDAITGIPIIMSIKDVGESNFVNYGSFMLNVDKTGDALKFVAEEGIDECISFEGTSNDLNSGLSSRFIINNLNQDSFDLIYRKLITENDSLDQFYSEIVGGEYRINKSDLSTNSTLLAMVNVLNYLAEGLEYRYPDNDIISSKETYYIIMPLPQFKRLFDMFYWVATSSSLSELEYKELFVQYFNYDYCALYFIFLMVFAQTDNLGKNCMFDLWFNPFDSSNESRDCLWYPRPYDLDSLTGLDNNGNDGIAPFIEISPKFSLNYRDKNLEESDSDYAEFLEENHLKIDSTLEYPESTTTDLQGIAKRYSFSSSSSNLWFNFYKNFKEDIRRTYKELRNYTVNDSSLIYDENGTATLLSSDTILKFYKELVLDLFGYSLYNLDFQLKYLGDVELGGRSRLFFGLGNRWDKFSNWIKKRIQFCDIYFYSREFNVELSVFNKEILLNSPLYIITKYSLNNATESIYFFDGENKVKVSVSGDEETTATSGLKYSIWINPEAILEGNIYSSLQSSNPKMPLDSIINLDITGAVLSLVIDIKNANYLSNLRITKLQTFYDNPLPKNIKNIIIENSSALLNISDLPYLLSITIRNCKAQGGTLILENLGKLSPIILTIEDSELNLDLQNVNIITFTSTNNKINNLNITNVECPTLELRKQTLGVIGFAGDNSNINIIDFRESTFTSNLLDLSIIAPNVRHLLLNDTTGLYTIKSSNRFENLEFFGLMNSEVKNFIYDKEGENRIIDHFDGKLLPDNLPKVLYCLKYTENYTLGSESYTLPINYNSSSNDYYSGTSLASRAFNLELTPIEKIINLNIVDSNIVLENSNCTGVTKLFTNCSSLLSIENSTIKCLGFRMFKNCSSLKEIKNSTIKIGNDATEMFAKCNSLFYNEYIEPILTNNPLITNFTKFLFNTAFYHRNSLDLESNVVINFSKYNNATTLNEAFRLYLHSTPGYSLSSAEGITITFEGTLPTSVTSLLWTFELGGNYGNFTDWNNLVKNCNNLTQMNYAFYTCKPSSNTFYQISSDWLPNSSYLDLEDTFAYCNIKLNTYFKFKSNVRSCKNTFDGCITSDGYLFDVKDIFEDCNNLECASRCFYNNRWAMTSDTLNLNNNVSEEIIIAGLFGSDNINNVPEVFGKISGRYTTRNNISYGNDSPRTYGYNPPASSGIALLGIFYNRKVKLNDNESVTYNSSDLRGLFKNAIIRLDIPDGNILPVTLNSTNIDEAFLNTDIKGATLDVTLQNTISAQYAFYVLENHSYSTSKYYNFPKLINNGVVTNDIVPPTLPNTIRYAGWMFYNLTINNIPIDYFKYNNEFISLIDVQSMFRYTRINKLSYANNYGLLPNSITNVNYLFCDCHNLRGGIPNNLFNGNTNLIEMKGTFLNTGVLFLVSNDDRDKMSPLALYELAPNVKDVSYLFYYNCVLNMSLLLKIKYDCFKNCNILDFLFAYSPELLSGLVEINNDTNEETPTTEFEIDSPISMKKTFVINTGTKINFVIPELSELSKLKDISGIIHYHKDSSLVNHSNNSADNFVFDLISNLLNNIYSSNFDILKANVTLDRCLGGWNKDTSNSDLVTLLERCSISPDNDYLAALYLYNIDTSISTARGYLLILQ